MSRLLELDMVSMAGATGHAACHRLASEMMDLDPNLWVNGGVPCADRDMEQDLAQLAAYVCQRRVTSGEVLFIKAAELGLHQFGAGDYFTLEPWQRTAYALFAAATLTSHSILAQAQHDAREREERLRLAAMQQNAPLTPKGLADLQDAGSTTQSPDLPAASPVGGQEAMPETSPDQGVADTAAEGEGAGDAMPSAADALDEVTVTREGDVQPMQKGA